MFPASRLNLANVVKSTEHRRQDSYCPIVSYSCSNTVVKSDLGRTGFIWLMLPICPSLVEVRVRNSSRREMGTNRERLTAFCFRLVFSYLP